MDDNPVSVDYTDDKPCIEYKKNFNAILMNRLYYNEPKILDWLGEIVPWSKPSDEWDKYFMLEDFGEYIHITFYTKEYGYTLRIRFPKHETESGDRGYLGASFCSRKHRAGEDWLRGNDMSDGPLNQETWEWIRNRIIKNEMIQISATVRKSQPRITESK